MPKFIIESTHDEMLSSRFLTIPPGARNTISSKQWTAAQADQTVQDWMTEGWITATEITPE